MPLIIPLLISSFYINPVVPFSLLRSGRLVNSCIISALAASQPKALSEILVCSETCDLLRTYSSFKVYTDSSDRTRPDILVGFRVHHASYGITGSCSGRLNRRVVLGICQTLYCSLYSSHRCYTDLHQARMKNV